MGWVVLVIAVLLALVIAGWLWWTNSRGGAASMPAGRRATDEELASEPDPDAVPIIPPPSGAGVPMVPIVPTFGPEGAAAADDERGGPLPDVGGGEPSSDDERTAT